MSKINTSIYSFSFSRKCRVASPIKSGEAEVKTSEGLGADAPVSPAQFVETDQASFPIRSIACLKEVPFQRYEQCRMVQMQ